MKSTRQARPAFGWMGLFSVAFAALPAFAAANVLDLVYERTLMRAADERCDLFAPEISGALAAAQVQARGAALRAGVDADDLVLLERQARARAASSDCAAPALAAAAANVRNAFSGYAKLQRIEYPGDVAGWRADRTGLGAIRWRLSQESRAGNDRLIFGLAGRQTPGLLLAVVQFSGGEQPYSARLLLRDASRTPRPYLDVPGGAVRGASLDRRLPPRSALRAYAAEARSPAGTDLLPKAGKGWAFRFPADAVRDLSGLDPREAIAVEFLFAGDVTRRFYVEVGDFAAGRAFLTLAAR